MPPKRTYEACVKCNKNCIGRYKDEQGGALCKDCKPAGATTKETKRICICNQCGHGHYDMKGDGMCSKCRDKENMRSTIVQRCITCRTAMRTIIKDMIECVNCIGRAKYQRLLYAHHKT